MNETLPADGPTYASIEEALERLQSILLARVEGKLGPDEDAEYRRLRRALMHNPEMQERLPAIVRDNRDLGGVWSVLRDIDGWEPRRMFIREQMTAALEFAFEQALSTTEAAHTPSSSWTGIETPAERLAAARRLLPLVQSTVDGLIAELERPGGNGGPPLENREEALRNLRELHRVLGELVAELERPETLRLSQRLINEAESYFSRAAKALRDDPMPYLVSAGLCGLLSVLGAGTLGGYLAGVAGTVRKNAGRE